MEVWILVFIVVLILKGIKVPAKGSDVKPSYRRSSRRRREARGCGMPWISSSRRRRANKKYYWD